MKLSELDPSQIRLVKAGEPETDSAPAPIKLSELDPSQVMLVKAERGEKVYDQPIGPERPGLQGVMDRVKDPARWEAIIKGTGPHAQKVVQGDVPLAVPAAALPKVAALATKLAEGKGLGYVAARTALSTGQGAVAGALDSKEGENLGDRIDRAKSMAKLSGGIQLAAESLPYVGKIAAPVLRKVGSAISGVAEPILENYAKRTEWVNKIIKENGGDMTAAADQVRAELSNGIQATKKRLNDQVSKAIEAAPQAKSFDLDGVLSPLEKQRSTLLSNHQVEEARQLEGIIEKIKRFGHEADPVYGATQYTGKVNAKELNSIKGLLQDIATPAYGKPGEVFNYAKASQRAAKYGAAQARKVLNQAVPEVAQANNQLSAMHAIEENLNRNLLAAGKPDAALFAAGSGANPRNQKMLGKLGEAAGVDVIQRVKDLATAKEFASPALVPSDFTGKALARMAVGAGVGGYLDGKEGAAVGGAIASPMGMKVAINAANVAKRMPGIAQTLSASKFIRENPIAAQALVQMGAKRIRDANPEKPEAEAPQAPIMGEAPRGYDKWAMKGLDNLGIKDARLAEQLIQDKQTRRLLIEASDLKPGSARMNRIKEQIESLRKDSRNDSLTGTPSKVLRQQREPARGR